MTLVLCKTRDTLDTELPAIKARGDLALVPTMGALHSGHMALVNEAKQRAETVIVTIFVNPAQFGPTEDFSRYPRTLEADIALCQEAGVDLVYAPDVSDIYPNGFTTSVSVGKLATLWEGTFRPGHFDGVATVLSILFHQIKPQLAIFGEKDYQQLQVIQTFVRDLSFPITIFGLPTIREPDGLALSSRNRYLTTEERAIAPLLHTIMEETAAVLRAQGNASTILQNTQKKLLDGGFTKVDYVALADAETLEALSALIRPARLLAAAWLGKTRLIDNIPVDIGT